METSLLSFEKNHLQKLAKVLNYELSSSILFAFAFFSPAALPVLMIAALLFIPFMVYHLYMSGKIRWIAGFFISEMITFLAILLILGTAYLKVTLLIPLAVFYFYTILLKMHVNESISALKAREEYERIKLMKKMEMETWQNQFDKN